MINDKDTKLSFVSEVGTFGSMGIKDTTIVEADLEPATEDYNADNIRAKALNDYLKNNRKGENNEF